MTNKEFAFKYAGKEFMLDDDGVVLVGYAKGQFRFVIVSPIGGVWQNWYWDNLDSSDAIIYRPDVEVYRYARTDELIFVDDEKPQTEVKPMAPG